MSDLFSYLDVKGPLFDYLGHFRQSANLECGHNTTKDKPSDAEQMDDTIQELGEGRLNETTSSESEGA